MLSSDSIEKHLRVQSFLKALRIPSFYVCLPQQHSFSLVYCTEKYFSQISLLFSSLKHTVLLWNFHFPIFEKRQRNISLSPQSKPSTLNGKYEVTDFLEQKGNMARWDLDSPGKSEDPLAERPLRLENSSCIAIVYNITENLDFHVKLAYTELYYFRLLKIMKIQTRSLNLFRPPAASLPLNVL